MREAATMTAIEFVDTHFLNGEAYAFSDNPDRYRSFRNEIGLKLSILENRIRLVGSGKLGFSLNKDHLLQRFCRESDLDLVVIAAEIFDAATLELLQNSRELTLAGADEKHRLRKTRENVFNGYLRPDQLPLGSTLNRDWFPKLAGPYESDVARSRPVKAWLFKSLEHAQLCYRAYIEQIQPSIRRLLESRGDL